METPPAPAAEALRAVRDLCAALDPAAMPAEQVAPVFDTLTAMRRLVDGAITRLAPRYERTGVWRDRGERSAADAVARATGTTPADSRRRLDTGRRLERSDVLDGALRAGEVSTEQATVIAGAAETGDAAKRLIGVARSDSHRRLREEAARERAKHDRDAEARRQRQHRRRAVRRWVDEEGMYNLHLCTRPEVGAEIDARLKPLVDAVFAEARREGRREPVPAYAADAVAELLASGAPSGRRSSCSGSQAVRPERKVIALVDIEALRRGHVEGGETCEIAGVGPVSVSAVRAMFGDAATAAVFRDAVDVRSVVHLGRQVTAVQRTALEARGAVCGVVGCDSTHHLDIDHTVGWTYTKVTAVDDLEWLCSTDHSLKTKHDLLAIGPPGHRVLVERDPDDPTKPKSPLVQVRPAPDGDGAPIGGAAPATEASRPPGAGTMAGPPAQLDLLGPAP